MTTSVPSIRSWAELVDAGRRAAENLSESKWELGDLANQVLPVGAVNRWDETSAWDVLLDFAAEIGVEFHTLRSYRQVAAAWAPEERSPELSFTAHRELMRADDPVAVKEELLAKTPPNGKTWTKSAIQEHLGSAGGNRGGSNRKAARQAPVRKAKTPKNASAAKDIVREADELRRWLNGADLGPQQKADLAEDVDTALQYLREAKKRLV